MSKVSSAIQKKNMDRMRRKSRAIYAERRSEKEADLRSRNAYRAAIGLPLIGDPEPLIEPGKD